MSESRKRLLRALAGVVAIACALAFTLATGRSAESVTRNAGGRPRYIVIAWNDLGMHCYNGSFSEMLVLPPYNTLWAQVIELGDPPRIVTSGVRLTYSVPGNTWSAGKTDFWDYATKALKLSTPLPRNVGLTGKGLSGQMDLTGDHYQATGIPLTEYADADKTTRRPFQLASISVIRVSDGSVLATTSVVAPVSSEMSCQNCHADDGDATTKYPIEPQGDFQANIVALHDYLNKGRYPAGHTAPLLGRRPVLCAECHADAALGKAGIAGVSSLSNAMHRHHNPQNAPDITPDTDGCYSCHPGPDTKCLRDTMTQHFGFGCPDCHGTIEQVATNPRPWQQEPRCGDAGCHGASFRTLQPLYRNSKGHGALYCPACHDSPHASATSREPNDAAKFIKLQGMAGTLRVCTTCHATDPGSAFHHDIAGGGFFEARVTAESPAGSIASAPSFSSRVYVNAKGGANATVGWGSVHAIVGANRLVFQSTSVKRVDVGGDRAKLVGYGRIGPTSGYRFTLTAVDGGARPPHRADALHLVVTNAKGVKVYDSMPGAGPYESPDPVLSGPVVVVPR
jgi:hypothetical protein